MWIRIQIRIRNTGVDMRGCEVMVYWYISDCTVALPYKKTQHVSFTLHMKLFIPEIYLSVFIYSMNLKQKLSPIKLYCFHMKGYCILQYNYNCIINLSNLLAVCVCRKGWDYHCAAKISHPRFAAQCQNTRIGVNTIIKVFNSFQLLQ